MARDMTYKVYVSSAVVAFEKSYLQVREVRSTGP